MLRQTKEPPFFELNGKRSHLDSFNIKQVEGAKKYVPDTAPTIYHSSGTAAIHPEGREVL